MNKKIFFSAVVSMAMLMVTGLAVAEEPSVSPVKKMRKEEKVQVKSEMKENKSMVKQEMKETRKMVKEEVKTKKEEVKTRTMEAKEKAKDQLKVKAEELKTKREEVKENLKMKREEMKETVKVKKEELREKIKTIKDERKKKAVEKIDDSLAKLNEKMTGHSLEVLAKIENALARVEERAGAAEGRGLNVATVRMAVTGAETAIASARTAVEAQVGKNYTLAVTTEANLKRDVGAARQALHADLAVVNRAVKAAHEAVRKAAVALAQTPRVDEKPAASVTPTPVQ